MTWADFKDDLTADSVLPPIIVFSDVLFEGNGRRIARGIKKEDPSGSLTKSPLARNSSGNNTEIWIWVPSKAYQKAFHAARASG
jgi:hypothetical protein